MPARKTRILLVDDHALFRRGLATLLQAQPDLVVCAEAATHAAGLDAAAASRPDLVIADLSLERSDGLEMIKELKRRFPNLPVLVLSMHDEAVYAERALRAGARGYVSKAEIDETVIVALRRVLAGELHTSDAVGRHFTRKFVDGVTLQKPAGLEALTDRELEVFKRIGRGQRTLEIARSLCVSVKTIETYRQRLKAKLELPSGAELIRRAVLWVETGRIG